jgi:hypothetical protein
MQLPLWIKTLFLAPLNPLFWVARLLPMRAKIPLYHTSLILSSKKIVFHFVQNFPKNPLQNFFKSGII